MKKFTGLIAFLFFCLQWTARAQDITYRIANKEVTAAGVEFDVTLESGTAFKLGSGQVYLNYNTAAFGTSGVAAGLITVTTPPGSVLALGWYGTFITNDNTASRFSFSWQQALSSGYFSENIDPASAILFHVKMDFQFGGSGQDDQICFESGGVYDDQTFTACGPHTPPPPFPQIAPANCTGFPGIQLTDDTFDCPCPDLVLHNNNAGNTAILAGDYSGNSITSDGLVTGTSVVNLTAPSHILLEAGFTVESGGELTATIGPCGSMQAKPGMD